MALKRKLSWFVDKLIKLVFDRLWISGSVGITSSNLYCHF